MPLRVELIYGMKPIYVRTYTSMSSCLNLVARPSWLLTVQCLQSVQGDPIVYSLSSNGRLNADSSLKRADDYLQLCLRLRPFDSHQLLILSHNKQRISSRVADLRVWVQKHTTKLLLNFCTDSQHCHHACIYLYSCFDLLDIAGFEMRLPHLVEEPSPCEVLIS